MAGLVVLGRAHRARWLARRRRGLTATDVPVVLGLSPWRTPLEVWLDKLDPRPTDSSYAMRRGLRMEAWLADEYARAHCTAPGEHVERGPALLAHRDHPWLLCSLDYLAHHRTETVIVECKTRGAWSPEWADQDLPDVYAVQALVQAAITGLPVIVWADVAGRPEMRRIEPDPQWEADTLPTLHAWWTRHIVDGQPPPLHPTRDYPHLARVWTPTPGQTATATEPVMGAVQVAATLRARTGVLDDLIRAARTQIRQHMGTATLLTDPDTGAIVARINTAGTLTVTYTPPTDDQPEGTAA